jgi:ABC-type transporter Mla subunit MlaD
LSEFDGKVVYKVEADTSGVDDAIKDTEQAFRDAGKDIDKSGDKIAGVFKKISVAALAMKAAKALLDFGKEAVGLASDLEEVQNVVDVTFGANNSTIESWAKNAGKQFGLTEIQAKKFTSTIGAMLKSAGMAGPEIVSMSTDLAGLAADMASFYNLDFDTAFQKIRSGISGETEPLKQLGINMSVANLEAFALTQGITKSFEAMSQSEQTMLRYQYLMQATADAQGDFARTSDSFANSTRTFETNIATLKANIGSVLIPAVSGATQFVNDLFAALTPAQEQRTVLDDIADIDLNTESKIKKIEETQSSAQILLSILKDIESIDPSASVGNTAEEAERLNPSVVSNWETFRDAAKEAADNKGNATGVKNVKNSANGLSADKAGLWERLSSSVTGILNANDASGAAEAMSDIKDSALVLTQSDVKPWTDYADALKAIDEAQQKAVTESKKPLSGDEADETQRLVNVASRLGITLDSTANAHELWLATCRQLVDVLPGLNSIINTETGEIEGGTNAVNDYIDAWVKAEKARVYWNAHRLKGEAIAKEYQDVYEEEVRVERLRRERERKAQAFEELGGIEEYNKVFRTNTQGLEGNALAYWFGTSNVSESPIGAAYDELKALDEQLNTAEKNLEKRTSARDKAFAEWEEDGEIIRDLYGDVNDLTDAEEKNAKATADMTDAVKSAEDALKSVADYIEQTREETRRSIDSVAKGFEEIQTPAQKARAEVSDLKKALEEAGDEASRDAIGKSLRNAEQTANNAVKTIQSMNRGLESQIAYYDRYNEMMETAKGRGVSDEVLASLSDGSQESFDYLEALVNASDGDIAKLNANYARLGQSKNTLTDTLTQQKLSVDETFNGLVESAQNAVAQLDQSEAAGNAVANTVQGIIDGLNSKYPALVSAVDGILAQISRLSGLSFNFDLGGSGFVKSGSSSTVRGGETITPLAIGADYIPFDGFLASLHEGEAVLTAEENRAWQMFKNGGSSTANSIDYGRLSGEIWDKAPSMGGNVYLDGQTVGRVMSAQQADSLRNLTRSGWRA